MTIPSLNIPVEAVRGIGQKRSALLRPAGVETVSDLRLRGPGDAFGARQSGLPDLRIAHPVRDARLLSEARQAALRVVEADPDLSAPERRLLREMMDLEQRRRVELAGVG